MVTFLTMLQYKHGALNHYCERFISKMIVHPPSETCSFFNMSHFGKKPFIYTEVILPHSGFYCYGASGTNYSGTCCQSAQLFCCVSALFDTKTSVTLSFLISHSTSVTHKTEDLNNPLDENKRFSARCIFYIYFFAQI